ncbi:hypothetical protein [Spirosoma agri]|uniref:Uncharacterized protein n=1 Tax=Spirosoma agri TaxID=1987381 RepID=A0A6M0IJP6_9BACT|nr:hypothetical protein [Spirosoma agri]NEU68508.1 hypothetical protein [Spirosoma agri]
MNRFSVIYLLQKQYHHINSSTQPEAEALLEQLSTREGYTPIGIYDAKTELFYWEPTRQTQYNQSDIEEQGKLGNQMIDIAQRLRHQENDLKPQENSLSQLLSLDQA